MVKNSAYLERINKTESLLKCGISKEEISKILGIKQATIKKYIKEIENKNKSKSKNVIKIIFIILIPILFLVVVYIYPNSKLSNDTEIIELESQNIGTIDSISVEIKPGVWSNKGANYNINFYSIQVKNDTNNILIILYFRKRLPLNTSIHCKIKHKNNSFENCLTVPPTNKIEDSFSIPRKKGGFYAPLQIQKNALEDDAEIHLNYSCPQCNPGGFELHLQNNFSVNNIYYSFYTRGVAWLIENKYELNTKPSEPTQEYGKIIFEGDMWKIRNESKNMSIKIIAKNYLIEVLFWIMISVMSGYIIFFLTLLFDKLRRS